MKKYLSIILMVISLFTITGCGPTTIFFYEIHK